MKKAVFVGFLSLVLPLAWMQPALARTISVQNQMSVPAKVDIVYVSHFCRDDHPTIAPKGAFTVGIGACLIKTFVVTWKHGLQCGPGVRQLSASTFTIREYEHPIRCNVGT